jgi:cytochrome c oxidase cbb3-type subunit I/II
MEAPDKISAGSIMPAYPWLITNTLDVSDLGKKIDALRSVGVPYEAGVTGSAQADAEKQAKGFVAVLKGEGVEVTHDKEIVALIAYLQRLGTDIKKSNQQVADQ